LASYQYEVDESLSLEEPKKYKVLLLNDDFSTMDFVVDVLTNIFHRTYEEAEKIMLEVHNKGKGVCGVYTHEIAETKVSQVKTQARANGYPLKAIVEQE
jgi:ATP-dependent Clp protease adaptor protein ClpS